MRVTHQRLLRRGPGEDSTGHRAAATQSCDTPQEYRLRRAHRRKLTVVCARAVRNVRMPLDPVEAGLTLLFGRAYHPPRRRTRPALTGARRVCVPLGVARRVPRPDGEDRAEPG